MAQLTMISNPAVKKAVEENVKNKAKIAEIIKQTDDSIWVPTDEEVYTEIYGRSLDFREQTFHHHDVLSVAVPAEISLFDQKETNKDVCNIPESGKFGKDEVFFCRQMGIVLAEDFPTGHIADLMRYGMLRLRFRSKTFLEEKLRYFPGVYGASHTPDQSAAPTDYVQIGGLGIPARTFKAWLKFPSDLTYDFQLVTRAGTYLATDMFEVWMRGIYGFKG